MKYIKGYNKTNENNIDPVLVNLTEINDSFDTSLVSYIKDFEKILEENENYYNMSIQISSLKNKLQKKLDILVSTIGIAKEHLEDISDYQNISSDLDGEIHKSEKIIKSIKILIDTLYSTKTLYADLYDNVKYIRNFKITY